MVVRQMIVFSWIYARFSGQMFRRFGGVYLGSASIFFLYNGRYLFPITSASTQNN